MTSKKINWTKLGVIATVVFGSIGLYLTFMSHQTDNGVHLSSSANSGIIAPGNSGSISQENYGPKELILSYAPVRLNVSSGTTLRQIFSLIIGNFDPQQRLSVYVPNTRIMPGLVSIDKSDGTSGTGIQVANGQMMPFTKLQIEFATDRTINEQDVSFRIAPQ